MVRAPSIRGRPTPQKKHKSSITTNSSGDNSSSSILPQRNTAITKSLKRAQKRAQLLSRTNTSTTEIRGDGGPLSKSSLRRRKRKARDELAKDDQEGRKGGISDLKDAMDELDEEIQLEDEEDEDVDSGEYSTGPLAAANAIKGGRVTTNHRKRVLQQEQARQKAILSNPTFQKSPFAALREHARNSMVSQPTRSR